MSEAKHTPGPWRAELQTTNYRSGAKTLCITKDCDTGVAQTIAQIVGIDARQANARLIAAAPELLEALEDICDTLGECGMTVKARAAIAKATGS
ncbi:hypothetical protein [Bosea thiooxidans]|uniref:hypothetical protein n=1 Tax=Bosea thiooxidans TaxID=53254 RepID=UPI0011174693|nr:hypothetical protein [Bosea thiooxidans]